MKFFRTVIFIIFGAMLLATTSQAIFGGETVSINTCLDVKSTKELPVQIIKGYTMQTKPIEAVLFTTVRNRLICADPKQEWVKKAVESLDRRTRTPSNQKKTPARTPKRKRRNQKAI
ncbi:C-C motif chemokine 13-like [Spea bombifrons]|uniref:C-C motif chemokine 13-like n=1 Tax=Spea bombifrons TaxID=233779 RepID=UPI00234AE8AC|nr:C-C motif chemokine 13-like [Spea bombifrons]